MLDRLGLLAPGELVGRLRHLLCRLGQPPGVAAREGGVVDRRLGQRLIGSDERGWPSTSCLACRIETT